VLKLRSVKSIVIPPAKTGKDNNNKIAVTKTAQPNNGTLCNTCPGIRIFITVVMKFIAPSRDDIPARCSEKMAKSTDPPLWACAAAKGG
jgi:hypothetical protein